MKVSASLSFLVLVASYFPSIVLGASLEAHAVERIVYWANYLAEEEYILAPGATRQYTIAPGCTGSRAGGRCNFAELLLYIWAPETRTGDLTRPTGWTSAPPDPLDFTKNWNTAGLMRALRNVKTDKDGITGAKLRILGNVDAARILPGSGLDYYGMMATMGSKIQQLIASRNAASLLPTRLQAAIESWGKDAAQAVIDLRWEDSEKYRLADLRKPANGLGLDIRTKKYKVGVTGRTFDLLDATATINGNAADEVRLNQATVSWAQGTFGTNAAAQNSARDHWNAIHGAQQGGLHVGCTLP